MIEGKHCPDCGGSLGRAATKCRCGWQAPTPQRGPRAYRVCEFKPGCQYPGRMPANGKLVCVVCYDDALRPQLAREPGSDDEPMRL